ncbi:hypothetical protein [Microbacterium sp. Leaf179]|nr:hypothetical protein [Microbacterium sp. Leaf179]
MTISLAYLNIPHVVTGLPDASHRDHQFAHKSSDWDGVGGDGC